MVTPSVMPSMMTSDPRAPSVVGRTPNGRRWPGRPALNASSTAAFFSSGTSWLAVPGPVATPVAVNTSVVWSWPVTARSTVTLTGLSKPALRGVPVKTRPLLPEMPDSVVPPVASLVSFAGASTIRSLIPMNRPRCPESMMIRLSSLPTGSGASGLISHEALVRSTACRVASRPARPTTAWSTPLALISISS